MTFRFNEIEGARDLRGSYSAYGNKPSFLPLPAGTSDDPHPDHR